MYAKLFSSITESSLWSEPKEVRLLFVSMLAKADSGGFVEASIPGLARVANLTIEETLSALEVLKSPDPYSKNPAYEGRRIAEIPQGFVLLNYEDYRERRNSAERQVYMREYMKQYRQDKQWRKPDVNSRKPTEAEISRGKPRLAQAEAEAEAEADTEALNTDSLVAKNLAPKPAPAEVVLTYPCSGKAKEWRLTESQLAEWQASYSGLDVLAECKKALQWLKANRLKTAGGMPRFLVSWLNRANDRPSGGNGRMLTPAQQREANMKANLDEARRAAGLEQFQGMIRINHERKTDG